MRQVYSGTTSRKICCWALLGLLAATRASFADEPTELQGDPAAAGQANEPPTPNTTSLPWRRFEFTFGASYGSIRSSVSLTKNGQAASLAVNPELALGLPSEAFTPEVWTAFRFGERLRIQFAYSGTHRTATETLSRDVVFNGFTYSLNTTVHSIMDVDFFELGFIYSFYQDKQMDFGVSLGVDVLRTHFAIDSQSQHHFDNERTNVPIPIPGLVYDYAFYPNLWVRQRFDWGYLSANQWSGLISKFYMAFEWSFSDHLAVGLGASVTWVNFRKESNSGTFGNLTGEVSYNTPGLLLYLNFFM